MKRVLFLSAMAAIAINSMGQAWTYYPYGGSTASAFSVPNVNVYDAATISGKYNTADVLDYYEFDQVDGTLAVWDVTKTLENRDIDRTILEASATGTSTTAWNAGTGQPRNSVEKSTSALMPNWCKINANPQCFENFFGGTVFYTVTFTQPGTYNAVLRLRGGSATGLTQEVKILNLSDISQEIADLSFNSSGLSISTTNTLAGTVSTDGSSEAVAMAKSVTGGGQKSSFWVKSISNTLTVTSAPVTYLVKVKQTGGSSTNSFGGITFFHTPSGPSNPVTVSITSPTSGFETTPGNITVTANASTTNTSISQVEFFDGATSLGVDNDGSDGWSKVINVSTTSTLSLNAVATDNLNQSNTSSTATVKVYAYTIPSIELINSVTDLSVGSINDGTVLTDGMTNINNYAFQVLTNPNGNLTDCKVYFTFTNPSSVVYTRNESGAPFALFGDNSGNYAPWSGMAIPVTAPEYGTYTLKGEIKTNATSAVIDSKTINFTLQNIPQVTIPGSFEAENYGSATDTESGKVSGNTLFRPFDDVETELVSGNNYAVSSIKDGESLVFNLSSYTEGWYGIQVNYSTNGVNENHGYIDVYKVDDAVETLIGTIHITGNQSTGWNDFKTISQGMDFTAMSGATKQIKLAFRQGDNAAELFNIDNISIDVPTGMKPSSTGSNMKAFYANQILNIATAGQGSYKLITVSGKLVSEGKINERVAAPLSLTNGIYLLNVQTDKGIYKQKILVK